jgi:hypothetical protein
VNLKYKQVSVALRTGRLLIETEAARIPLRRLIGFASRINSKRGFLFISKLLGKHYPVSPRKMAWSYRALAKRILSQTEFNGPSLWVGMAETATGLGYGIFAAAYALGVREGLFMQTTRYLLSGCERIEFVEAHSHATDFSLYWPDIPTDRQTFLHAEQLILMDDEISTGATFSRLITAYRAINPSLKSVVIASLVNFANTEHRRQVEVEAGIPVHWVYLLQGRWQFAAIEGAVERSMDNNINVIGNGACKKNLLAWPGRLGIDRPIEISARNIQDFLALLPLAADHRPILVLGTGECNPPAYLLGRALEQQGFPVIVQATTRSPIFVEGDIGSRIHFSDNYQDNIHNFLYNINIDAYRLIVFCHETPLSAGIGNDELDFIGVIKHMRGISAQFTYQNGQYAEFIFCRP